MRIRKRSTDTKYHMQNSIEANVTQQDAAQAEPTADASNAEVEQNPETESTTNDDDSPELAQSSDDRVS